MRLIPFSFEPVSNETKNVFEAELSRKLWTKKHEGFFTGHPVYIQQVHYNMDDNF